MISSNSLTYLGVKLNSHLTDDDDIFRQVKSLYCAANKLRFLHCSHAVKIVLFRAYCTYYMLPISGISLINLHYAGLKLHIMMPTGTCLICLTILVLALMKLKIMWSRLMHY